MIAALLLSVSVACPVPADLPTPLPGGAVSPPAAASPATADTVEAGLYAAAADFPAFLEATRRRRDTWHANYERAQAFGDLAERARAVPGEWRLLVVAVDACGDSANTIPYLARFVEAVDGLELRVVEPDVGRPVMDAHPTPDGRGATPTVVVLDAQGNDVRCWIERPAGIQSWWIVNPDGLSTGEKLDRKYAWYDDDGGYSTIREVVEAVEAAARGERVCRRPLDETGAFPAAGPGGAGAPST